MKPQFSIRQLLAVIVPIAVGLAAIANPTQFWEACILALSLLILFTAIIYAIYRTASARAFWIGFSIFGWGYIILCAAGSFEFGSPIRYRNTSSIWAISDEHDPPLRAFTKSLVDYLRLYRRTVPTRVGEKVEVQWGNPSSYYPATVLAISGNMYRIRYDSDPSGAFDESVGVARIRLADLDRSYRICELISTLLFALAGGLIARHIRATQKFSEPDGPVRAVANVTGAHGNS